MPFRLLVLLIFLRSFVAAQENGLVNYNHVYEPHIQTVQFHPVSSELEPPIVRLQQGTPLRLAFDDMEADNKNYTYSIVHCDRNWQPSDLTEMEYLNGFQGELFREFAFSIKTLTLFTHYELTLPNQRMSWTKSGNYLLHIFDEEGSPFPVITRRFVVVENQVRVEAFNRVPSTVSKSRTHQEIDFIVDHQNLIIRNPLVEIGAVVLQNGRWDNAIMDLKPLFIRGKQSVFDYQDKIIFPGGNEFRSLDLRSLRTRSSQVAEIQRNPEFWEVRMAADKRRDRMVHLFYQDAEGQFVIDNFDQPFDPNLSADYVDVLFTLLSDDTFENRDVYLFGGFTDWKVQERYRLRYNPALNAYVGKAFLKQGFYDYWYVTLDNQAEIPRPETAFTEGNHDETNNRYSILIYYRPFGSRYDQVIGHLSFQPLR
jgi:hypothetical protein